MNQRLLFIAICLLFSGFAKAEIPDANPEGLVEVYSMPNYDKPYRERRPTWTWNLAVQYESMSPNDYSSDLDTGNKFGEIFGQPMTNIQTLLGPKYNTRIGALGLDFLYGRGDVAHKGDTLSLTKTGIAVTYTMDTLLPNPYVAPYIQYQAFSMSYAEHAAPVGAFVGGDTTGNIALASAVVGGLLIQLNWLDDAGARAGFVEDGIQNSYIDLFAASYMSTKSASSPEFQSTTLGAGFRVEF